MLRASQARNASRSGQLLISQGVGYSRVLLFLGKKDDLWALILEYGMVNLCLRDGLV